MQLDFTLPDFLENNSAEEIHERMMNNLPDDIDDMPGGFPYDFTKPAALEKAELLEFHLPRSVMIAFPQYAWDEWLDLHGKQVHLERHEARKASGILRIAGKAGTVLAAGAVFCTLATDSCSSLEFIADQECTIGEDGTAEVNVTAADPGSESNVKANLITMMAKPVKGITEVSNPEQMRGGTDRESNDDYYDRIAAEYENSLTFLGNDGDYIRWAKEAGAGDCIVIPAAEGPGTGKLVWVHGMGQPADEALVQDVYNYIVSPEDRSKRLLPTACAKLICGSAVTVKVDYTITGLVYDSTTDLEQIQEDFTAAVKAVYVSAKQQNVLRYNDVRPVISDIPGVTDFEGFLVNGEMRNIHLGREEYPETANLDFS